MKAINVLLAILVSLAVFLGVFEVGLRVLGMGPPKVLNQFDENLGWSKEPGKNVKRKSSEFKVNFRINELGLRDDLDQTIEKPDGTKRVICLGDSFTLGYTVSRENLFVDQLEHWWQEEGRKVDVVNTGTEGYSTDQEVAWLQKHGPAWKPDLVLLFAYENDLYYNGQNNYIRFPKPRFDVQGNLVSTTLQDPGSRGALATTAIGNLLISKKGLDTFEPKTASGFWAKEWAPLLKPTPDFMEPALQGTRGAFEALRKTCQELGAEVAVVVIPSHSAVNEDYAKTFGESVLGIPRSDWDPNQPVEMLLNAARAAGLTALDPRPQMRTALASGDPADGGLYYTKDREFHLNPRGNRVLGEFVHAALADKGLTPGEGKVLASLPHPPPLHSGGFPTWLGVYLILVAVVGSLYGAYYKDEKVWACFLKVAGLLALVFGIALGGSAILGSLSPAFARIALMLALVALFGFIFYKLGDRLGTITELFGCFIKRGHWYLMPLVMILLSVGSLLVVAASSPLVAPFIYTLF